MAFPRGGSGIAVSMKRLLKGRGGWAKGMDPRKERLLRLQAAEKLLEWKWEDHCTKEKTQDTRK